MACRGNKIRILTAGLGFVFSLLRSQGVELRFADFNNQGLFNHFSGDSGAFTKGNSEISGICDTNIFHGSSGASLRIDYSVRSGFCGIWNSLMGEVRYPYHFLNFTNLYHPLRNSTGNPSRIEGVSVTNFSFWARGNGQGEYEHKVKVEFKGTKSLLGHMLFTIPNQGDWTQYSFPISRLDTNHLADVKEVVFVIEDWQNSNRVSSVYLDDLAFVTDEPDYDPHDWDNDAMLDVVSQRAFSYFLRFTDTQGFALDRSTFSDMVSVGTIGFQLTAYCIGHQRGWADLQDLENRVVTILKNLKKIPMGPEGGNLCGGYRGFYYHFLTANTGLRKDESVELSVYDTMLLMYGVLTCKEYFPGNTEIQALSQELFDRVEWDWFVDRARGKNRYQFHLAWKPGGKSEGAFNNHVDGQTDEALMVDILALGSKTHPITLNTHLARNRVFSTYPSTNKNPVMVSWNGSLFNYFFASCWLDLKPRGTDLHPENAVNVWVNNQRAIIANHEFCVRRQSDQVNGSPGRYTTYGENSWGLTACENLPPPGRGVAGDYLPFGALPTEENVRFGTKAPHAGTLAVYGAASSINFTPEESLAAVRRYFEIPGLWNPLFGFGDAFSLDPHYVGPPFDKQGNPTVRFADHLNGPWINNMTMGINVGPMLLAIENYRSQQIWKLCVRNPEITAGLDQIFGLGSTEPLAVSVETNGRKKNVNLRWNPRPGASEYRVFASTDQKNWTLLQGGITGTDWTDHQFRDEDQRFYNVKAIR